MVSRRLGARRARSRSGSSVTKRNVGPLRRGRSGAGSAEAGELVDVDVPERGHPRPEAEPGPCRLLRRRLGAPPDVQVGSATGRRQGAHQDGATVVVEGLTSPGRGQHRDGIVEPLTAARRVDAEHGVLVRSVAHAEGHLDAPVADQAQCGEVLGQPYGIVQRRDERREVHRHATGPAEDGGGQHQRGGVVAVDVAVVLAEQHGLDADAVAPLALVEGRGPQARRVRAVGRRAQVVAETEPHRRTWLTVDPSSILAAPSQPSASPRSGVPDARHDRKAGRW